MDRPGDIDDGLERDVADPSMQQLGPPSVSGPEVSGMDMEQLWLRQVSIGGVTGSLELEAFVLGLLQPDRYRHNLIAQAINLSSNAASTTLSSTASRARRNGNRRLPFHCVARRRVAVLRHASMPRPGQPWPLRGDVQQAV